MKVSGFTFIRNAVQFDYPICEAIASILPVVDEMIVVLGRSDDDSLGLLQSMTSPKIRIVPSVWDDRLREGGRVLALETDKALAEVAADSDWAFYIQGDEVVHEKDLPAIRQAMEENLNQKEVEGLLFSYKHFYGSYDFVGDSHDWYRREIRIIRPHIGICSYRDAQGFRRKNEKLHVKLIPATIFHYGWVKSPEKQLDKMRSFNKLWHSDQWVEQHFGQKETFDYERVTFLKRFTDSHPAVMQERIARLNWVFDFDPSKRNFGFKSRLLHWVETTFHCRVGEYRNYIRLR